MSFRLSRCVERRGKIKEIVRGWVRTGRKAVECPGGSKRGCLRCWLDDGWGQYRVQMTLTGKERSERRI